jgi:hypothetical protein
MRIRELLSEEITGRTKISGAELKQLAQKYHIVGTNLYGGRGLSFDYGILQDVPAHIPKEKADALLLAAFPDHPEWGGQMREVAEEVWNIMEYEITDDRQYDAEPITFAFWVKEVNRYWWTGTDDEAPDDFTDD